MQKYVLLLLLLRASLTSIAQQPAYFRFADQQFEGVDIYDLTQDAEGDYWFATDEGLYRHDGYEFFKVESQEMNSVSLFNFVRNSKGEIYCNNLNQQVFQIQNGKCKLVYTIPDKGNDVSLTVTPQDFLIVGTGSHLYVLNREHELIDKSKELRGYLNAPFRSSGGTYVSHVSNSKLFVAIAKTGEISYKTIELVSPLSSYRFFRLNTGIYAIDFGHGKVYRVHPENYSLTFVCDRPDFLTRMAVRIYQLDDEVWIATSMGGIQHIRNERDLSQSNLRFFPEELISDVFKDREGNILLSTFDKGVYVIPNIWVKDVEQGLTDFNVTRIEVGNKGELILGTRSGELLSFTGSARVLQEKGIKAIEAIKNPEGSAYIFSDHQGFSITNLHNRTVLQPAIGSFKDVARTGKDTYVCAFNIGAYDIDLKNDKVASARKIYSGRTYFIDYERQHQSLYLSTTEGVLYRKRGNTFKPLLIDGQALNATYIQSLEDRTYIATRKKGLLCFRDGKIIDRIYPKMAGNPLVINQFICHKGQFYANTSEGFVILDKRGRILHILNKASGLSTNKIIDFCIQDDQLWIVHSRGVQRFSLKTIRSSRNVPSIRLRALYVNDSLQTITAKSNFYPSDQRKFRFVLQSPTLRHRENVVYHYRLIGLENTWHIQPYETNEIIYNALAPGIYRLEVMAENNGQFSEVQHFDFTILAPFYQRWWFILTSTLLFLFIVYLVYRRQVAIQTQTSKQINELNASRLTAIQSQMNPHFIFNSLNSIQDLVLKGDVDNSYTFITKFSNLVRRTLNYSDKDFIEFQQEIKLIELYLSLEKLRFKEELEYSIVTNEIDDISLPPMLIQPFIENALIHGLLHKEGLKKLRIRFELQENVLICEIEDNGVGRKRAQEIKERQRGDHESFAVSAIKRRFFILQQHFGSVLGFTYQDLEEGTRVRITLPVRRNF